MEVATIFQPPSSVFLPVREKRWEWRVQKYRAEGWANDMDVKGTPCQGGPQWWQETWERTSRPFNFWRGSWSSYLLRASVPSWNLSCALSHSEDSVCTHIYEDCLVFPLPSYFSSKSLAQAFLPLGSRSHRGPFDMRVSLDKQLLTCLYSAQEWIYSPNPQKPLQNHDNIKSQCAAWKTFMADWMHSV